MGYVDRENLLGRSEGSIYKLVNLAAKRALEIAEGQPKLVDVNAAFKPSTVALYEISANKVQAKRVKGKG